MSNERLGLKGFKIVCICSLGQFLGQGLATLIGIIIPLLLLSSGPTLGAGMQGVLGCISLIGIMVGSAVIGHLSDRFGYLTLFRLCPIICAVASLFVIFFPTVQILLPALFIMGFAISGEYSLDPNYISELLPEKWKTFMVGVAKATSSLGSVVVALLCYIVLKGEPSANVWPRLMWIIFGICMLMTLTRIRFDKNPTPLHRHKKEGGKSLRHFIITHPRQIILTGVPWACEGLGIYGIGIFMPMLLMAFKIVPAEATGHDTLSEINSSIMLTLILSVVMIIGFVIGLFCLKRISHLKMQTGGFILSALGLGLLWLSIYEQWPPFVAIIGFIIFEISINAGPHLITFILPSQTFDVKDRGTGAGMAAAIGKSGAVAGAFFMPVMLDKMGSEGLLAISIVVMLLGAVITILFRQHSAITKD